MKKILLFLFIPSLVFSITFAVVSDQTHYSGPDYDTDDYFTGVVKKIAEYNTDFMVIVGDLDRFQNTKWVIEKYLGTDYTWYAVCGNHDYPGAGEENYLGENKADFEAFNLNGNTLPGISYIGPENCKETMYGFDYEYIHMVNMNVYYRGTDNQDVYWGAVVDPIYNWLVDDLNNTNKELKFVFGHEVAYNFPDMDNDRLRHESTLNYLVRNEEARDRFWELLKNQYVTIYFAGHTHSVSVENIGGVWQVNTGHAMGKGDTGGPSTFMIVDVFGDKTKIRIFRDIHDNDYDYDDIIHTYEINTNKPVPVELSSFKATTYKQRLNLSWTTETETNNFGFNIYKSINIDGPWVKVNEQIYTGHGTTTEKKEYYYSTMYNGAKYYKLEQIDTNGQSTFYGPIEIQVDTPLEYRLYNNYPNPFNNGTTIEFDVPEPTHVNIQVFDVTGKLVETLKDELYQPGYYSILWNPQSISSGIYFIKLNNDIIKCSYLK